MRDKLFGAILDGISSGALVQGLITLVVLALWGTLTLQGRDIPELLGSILTLVLGFYFGGKVAGATSK